MADESNALPASRLVRWIAIAALLVVAIGLYLRDGRALAPLSAPSPGAGPVEVHEPPPEPAPGAPGRPPS